MKRLAGFLLLVLMMILLVACPSSMQKQIDPYLRTKETADNIGNSLITGQGDVTAVSIAIMHEGEIIYSRGFGKRDVSEGLPVDNGTRFNIGSVSKIFAATAILMLEDEGLLHLDDKVSDVLPAFKMIDERHKDITVRMLLNHTSGLPGTNMNETFSSEKADDYPEQTMQELSKASLKHEPGAFSPYCNDGFTVAQLVIEQITGTPYHQFLQERIFNPLGMNDTSVGFFHEESDMASAYANRTEPLPREFVNALASGGITSTAIDLCKYAMITFTPTFLSASGLSGFLSEQPPKYVQDSSYDRIFSFGLGWDMTSWEPYASQGIQVLGKSGGTLQYTSMLFVLPESQSAVALLCVGHADAVGTTLPIVETLLTETGLVPPGSKKLANGSMETVALPPDMDSYDGYYASDTGLFKVAFDSQSSTMKVESFDGSSFVHAFTSRHVGKNIFEDPQKKLIAVETVLNVPVLMEIRAPYNLAEIKMTRLGREGSFTEHEFQEGFWLPTNLRPYDLYVQIHQTKFIEELPSKLIVSGMTTIPYAITGSMNTSMSLPTLRDQTPPRIAEDGSLMIGAYQCMSHKDVLPLVPGETVKIDAEHTSVWRRVTKHGTLSCEIPAGGRVLILGPDFRVLKDTLYSKQNRIDKEVYGSYVAFIAKELALFKSGFALID